MATAADALKKMREICLAFPDTTEGSHFGITGFYVKKKLFATAGQKKDGQFEISFGLEPDHAELLVKKDPRFRPYPRDARGVLVNASDLKGWGDIETYLRESYSLRAPPPKPAKKPAARRAPAKKRPRAR